MTYPVAPAPVRRRRPLVVVALVAGLIVGGGAVGLGWALSGSSPDNTDVTAACDAVARTESIDPTSQYAAYLRWGGASSLASAAAEADPQYKPLADALRAPLDIVARTFQASGPQYDAAISAARQACTSV
ncbi:hypothetical protein [Amycolatopsis sp.]|uniref:hypothetical protein n=1 Tax=Amycolatopsis sp. TaxID=37632 RepID=UPI002D0C5EBE|nr:hypothetical protein [Amycolatopsis sp.]HVV13767.1 hypothetical protein [Amycolatopsis sp.]